MPALLIPVLRIRIGFNADPDPAFGFNAGPDPISQANLVHADPGQTVTKSWILT
jgi:hypothetical protein